MNNVFSGQAFQLPPLDAQGAALFAGSFVRILSTESCASGLPREDQERLRSLVGQIRPIVRFDRAGFAWLCFESSADSDGDFCIFPAETQRV